MMTLISSANNGCDIYWMQYALTLAQQAAAQQEVPVGAVMVKEGVVVGEGANAPIKLHDPSAHAEILALRAAAQTLENYRLLNTTLYVTLEPCLMCAAAMVHARIGRLVFGAFDPKTGAIISQCQSLNFPWLNHRVAYEGGILMDACQEILKNFFSAKR